MSKYYLTREDELYHWGIKGQKWGQRRYQNEDGSLTEEGKIRYGYTGEVRKDPSVKELIKDRKKRVNAESEAIKKSKVSSKEKARALSKLGKHSDSAEYYAKDFQNKRNALIIGSVAYEAARAIGSKVLANKVFNNEMSFDTAANISKAAFIGKTIVQSLLTVSALDSARKHDKEYWKTDK